MPHLLAAVVVCVSLCASAPASAEARRPNVLLILVDDMGTGDLSCYGARDVETPRIDRLAAEGLRFTAYYAAGAECTPTRTALLTGQYPQRVGGMECAIGTGNVGRYDDAVRLAARSELGLPPRDAVLAPALQQAGYDTAIFGKWHLGYDLKFNPLDHGFDCFFGFLGGYVDYFTHEELSDLAVLYEGRRPVERNGYMTELIADDAVRFLESPREQPFFLYVAFSVPHFPFQAPGDATGRTVLPEKLTEGTRETYIEMLRDMDRHTGRILDALEKAGLAGDTVVVFASDHGAMRPGSNGRFRGFKGGLFEGGIRTPLIVRWPGRIARGSDCAQPTITMDLTAALLRVAGTRPPADHPADGIDILRHVEEQRPEFSRTLFWRARRANRTWRAVRDGDWKFVSKVEDGAQDEWLFDVARDPAEERDLLTERLDAAEKLRAKLSKWERDVEPRR
ncbi:MAG: sulfatase-like hydrolase/transferase [Planctomycetes bacterium]|nr:sulfatase-like hydrolase/transferase [Planctomycetota bacterium]